MDISKIANAFTAAQQRQPGGIPDATLAQALYDSEGKIVAYARDGALYDVNGVVISTFDPATYAGPLTASTGTFNGDIYALGSGGILLDVGSQAGVVTDGDGGFAFLSGGIYVTIFDKFAGSTFPGIVRATGDVLADATGKGLVLKDNAGTPHYWRVSVSTLGVLTTADLGTTPP